MLALDLQRDARAHRAETIAAVGDDVEVTASGQDQQIAAHRFHARRLHDLISPSAQAHQHLAGAEALDDVADSERVTVGDDDLADSAAMHLAHAGRWHVDGDDVEAGDRRACNNP